jgi:hypothetical protein
MARPTRPPGFSLNVKLCIGVYIVSVLLLCCYSCLLFVLFLLVMRIWIDLQVLKIWEFGSTLESRRVNPSQDKLAAWEAC